MKFQVRLTKKEDYPELCEWWEYWRWGEGKPSLELLDDLKYGLMISNGTENICAGFIYFTNARQFGLMEYIVSTQKVREREIRKEALLYLIACLKQLAKEQGVTTLISYLISDSLIKNYLESGFVIGDKNATSLVCKL